MISVNICRCRAKLSIDWRPVWTGRAKSASHPYSAPSHCCICSGAGINILRVNMALHLLLWNSVLTHHLQDLMWDNKTTCTKHHKGSGENLVSTSLKWRRWGSVSQVAEADSRGMESVFTDGKSMWAIVEGWEIMFKCNQSLFNAQPSFWNQNPGVGLDFISLWCQTWWKQ